MSLDSYANLQTKLVELVDDSDFVAADAADSITLAEKRINKEVRHRHMEKALSGTMSSGVLAVPSDYVSLKFAQISGKRPFIRKSSEWIYQNYPVRSATGVPIYIARDVDNFIFGPHPDSDYALIGTYYYRFGALSAGLNDLFTDHPDLYLFCALAEVEAIIGRDERIAVWESKYQLIRTAVMNEEKDERFSGGPLAVTVA